MSVKYKMIERGDYLNPEGKKKTGFYPQIVRGRTVTMEDIALNMAKGKRLNAIEIKSTIELLIAYIEKELLNGNNICLDGFGSFFLTAQAKRPVSNPDELRAESIEVKRIAFKPSQPLCRRMKGAKFVRTK